MKKFRFRLLKYSVVLFTIILVLLLYIINQRGHIFLKPTGTVVDSLNGVYVYYNGRINNVSGRNILDGYNLGLKYQCVEFVKRYYLNYLHHKMPNSYGHAKDFFNPDIDDGKMNKERGLLQFRNSGIAKPEANDILVMDKTKSNPYGHVAIISKAGNEEIEIVQQNPGITGNSREKLKLSKQHNHWTVNHSRVLGWLRKN